MTIAALIVFAVLLISWLLVPAERRQRSRQVELPGLELAAEAA
jgi:hypothetical protein